MNHNYDPCLELYYYEDDRPRGWPYGIEQHEFERKECLQCQMMKDVHRLVRVVAGRGLPLRSPSQRMP